MGTDLTLMYIQKLLRGRRRENEYSSAVLKSEGWCEPHQRFSAYIFSIDTTVFMVDKLLVHLFL